jgi:hypothetical protein
MRSPAELNVVSESIRVRIPSPPLVQIPAKVVNMEGNITINFILVKDLD